MSLATIGPFKDATLFNCCTEHMEPNWSEYQRLQLSGCMTEGDEYTVSGVAAHHAEFFGIYGVDHEGMSMAITDTHCGASLEEGKALLERLSIVSGLPICIDGILETAQ